MLSSGVTLIFSMMGVVNFAHASFYMLGAYFAYQISSAVGFWPALVLAPICAGILGAALERWGLRGVRQHGHVAEMLFTFSFVLIIQEAVQLIWGRVAVPYAIPEELSFSISAGVGINYPVYRLFMVGISVGMFAALLLLITKTRIGIIVQASLTHPEMVGFLGHNVPKVFTFVFGFGCGLAGLAGVIGGNMFSTDPGMAHALGAIAFVVVVVGGLGSLGGALIASLLIGLLQNVSISVDGSLADLFRLANIQVGTTGPIAELMHLSLNRVAPLLPYLLMVVILAVRPRGLLGRRI